MSQIATRKRRIVIKTDRVPRQQVVMARRPPSYEAAAQRRELAMLLRSIKTLVHQRP